MGRTGSEGDDNRISCQDEAHFYVQEDCICFGVFDGHGPDGHIVAALCARELSSCLIDDQSFYFSQNNIEQAVKGGMESLQRRIDELPPHRADIDTSGATATIGYVSKSGIWIANVGDTRAIGARFDPVSKGFSVVQLSDEHILTIESEANRIIQQGGRVSPILIDGRPIGPPRCWFGYSDSDLPGLMVSRCLGDRIARSIGVNAECSLYHADKLAFLVVASDGLWEVMDSEQVVGFVAGYYMRPIPGLAVSEMLCLEAKKRWTQLEGKVADDVSAIVITFTV